MMAVKARRVLKGVLTPAVAFALLACSGDEARVQIAFWARDPLTIGMLNVRVQDGRHAYVLGREDFRDRRGVPFYDSPDLSTATRGTLRVGYALIASNGDTASVGDIELLLRPDWRWGIDIIPDSADPMQPCFGCQGSRGFRLSPTFRGPRVDSVFVLWGGNSIKKPVVY